jgi:beta-phosphoglucomutase-like phosphatase (HAD superfamily)
MIVYMRDIGNLSPRILIHACLFAHIKARFWGFAGVPLPDIVLALYQDKHGADSKPSEEFVAQFLQDKRAFHTAQEEEAGHPPAIKCVTDRIHYYKSRGIKVAVASSGLRDIVER